MNLPEVMNTIISSEPRDWHIIPCWGGGCGPSYRDYFAFHDTCDRETNVAHPEDQPNSAVYIPEVAITLAYGLKWIDDFKEEWAKGFPDQKSSGSFVDVFYNGALVFRDVYVNVDGGRGKLPVPITQTLHVPSMQHNFIRLLNSFEGDTSDFDGYFRRAGMALVDESWPRFGSERSSRLRYVY